MRVTTFSEWWGELLWTNQEFENGKALICTELQVKEGVQVYAYTTIKGGYVWCQNMVSLRIYKLPGNGPRGVEVEDFEE